MKRFLLFLGTIGLVLMLAACGDDGEANKENGSQNSMPDEITIGYFPNINHAAGMVAEEKDLYAETFPDGTTVNYQYFPDGSSFMTALAAGEIEGGLVGPGPAMNHFTSGSEINIIAGGSTGGTVIMARNDAGINSPEDLAGKTFISPRVGCTHDVQFETSMSDVYSLTSDRIGGKMKHVTGEPATYHSMFVSGKVDVATAPEPWASYIEQQGSGKAIIDTSDVAFGETLPAAVFVTSQDLANNNPELVQSIINGHKKATDFINENPEEAKNIARKKIADITGQELDASVINGAWDRMNFTYDIDGDVLQEFADSSYELQFLKERPDLEGLTNTNFLENK